VIVIKRVSCRDYADIVKHITDAVIGIDLSGTIIEWNKAAESLLGYASYEVLNLPFSIIYPKQFHHHIPLILETIAKGVKLSNTTMHVVHKNGGMVRVSLSVSPMMDDEEKAMGSLFMLRKLDETQELSAFFDEPQESEGRRRTFDELRLAILASLGNQQMTINQLSTYSGINWKTVENHLTYLLGKGFVKEVFRSDYIRIFEMTKQGKDHLARVGNQQLRRGVEEELR